MFISGSCVRSSDVDLDGDLDLFVGGRIIPGRYPETPQSVLLINNGDASFTIATIAEELKNAGMVTDAIWVDLNQDKYADLIVVGEWMGIEVFINEKGTLQQRTSDFIHEPTAGWWNCITAADFDNDGDKDFIIGNIGLNNQIKASPERPATMLFSDFDANGSVDPILTYYVMGKSFPSPSRDELVEQLPGFKKRFKDYASYSGADLDKILTAEERADASVLSMVQMQSTYIRNDGSRFVFKPLPIEMQIAPVFAVAVLDVDKDGNLDFIAGGNLSGTRSRTGKMTGNTGFVFSGDGKGGFRFVSPAQAGFRNLGDVRHVVIDDNRAIFAINSSAVQIYELNTKRLHDSVAGNP
jgi:hypothetical protein